MRNYNNRELRHRRSWTTNGNRKLNVLLLGLSDAIASVTASHQTPKVEFSSPRQVAETIQQREELISGRRSWPTNVCA